MTRWRRILLVAATLIAFAPLGSVLVAGTVANWAGCPLDEGSVHACVIAGADWGGLLYAMGVLGWLMLLTAPLMLLTILIWVWLLGRALVLRGRAARCRS